MQFRQEMATIPTTRALVLYKQPELVVLPKPAVKPELSPTPLLPVYKPTMLPMRTPSTVGALHIKRLLREHKTSAGYGYNKRMGNSKGQSDTTWYTDFEDANRRIRIREIDLILFQSAGYNTDNWGHGKYIATDIHILATVKSQGLLSHINGVFHRDGSGRIITREHGRSIDVNDKIWHTDQWLTVRDLRPADGYDIFIWAEEHGIGAEPITIEYARHYCVIRHNPLLPTRASWVNPKLENKYLEFARKEYGLTRNTVFKYLDPDTIKDAGTLSWYWKLSEAEVYSRLPMIKNAWEQSKPSKHIVGD